MEQNFQTSFIPKKPMIEQKVVTASKPAGFLLVISIIIFVAMIAVSAGAYFYKTTLSASVIQMQEDLVKARNRFEPTEITKLKNLDKRLDAANEVLSNHIAITPIFKALEVSTLKTIRYTSFSFDANDKKIIVKVSGQAVGYRSVALQADVFSKNKNLIDPVFSNLSLNDKGNVLFDLTFSVDPNFVNYGQILKTSNNVSNTTIIN